MIEATTPFEIAKAQLAELGLTLECQPGHYRVNYRGEREATARYASDLAEALDAGRQMAGHAPPPPLPPMGPCGRKNTRRGLMMVHNRKIAARRRRAAARAAREADKP